ncbi:MAG: DUF1883 domain-containing protein [Planctomycetes bacterium]|nr:DUF1883 domain-containing protein [Planctomycetota bacterium]
MNYLHYEFELGPDDIIEVTLDHAANVQLLDPPNFQNYKNGKPFKYTGGHVRTSPYRCRPPRSGHWHLVVDLGGGAGTVRASAQVLSSAS